MTNKFNIVIAVVTVAFLVGLAGFAYKSGNIHKLVDKVRFVISNKPAGDGEVIVYFLKDDRVERLEESGIAGFSHMPTDLIVPKGSYQLGDSGFGYTLNREGLYRFVVPNRKNIQKIVFESDIDALLSAIAWIVTHGNADDKKTFDELTEKAKTSKLFITCGNISEWAKIVLSEKGIKARVVGGITLDDWNDYDNGHRMLEVYRAELDKWLVYDLDNNTYFIDRLSKKPLNVVEFSARVASRDYQVVSLSADTRVDISAFQAKNGYDYGFFAEAINADLATWYARVMQVPLINDDGRYYFFDSEHRKKLEGYRPYYKYIEKAVFLKKFY
ncbi:transglutaminase domain-containing protein [Methylotuvimicrobium sp.]|uniref:transglutaminase domain-containing protein n=1 Tax=Methylotuvimicrobium sp. TaxID=2822413 RepID=UPI003D64C61E